MMILIGSYSVSHVGDMQLLYVHLQWRCHYGITRCTGARAKPVRVDFRYDE